jgi:hypothetical protein
MANIYVSGPVIRPDAVPDPAAQEWVRDVYRSVGESAQGLRMEAAYPTSETELEKANPRKFYNLIRARILPVNAAVVVFTGGDVSSGIEAAIASSMEKPILLVSNTPHRVPRLLAGLPYVSGLINPEEAVRGGIENFLREHHRGPSRMR